jgi:hypothetical protein
LFLVLGCSAKPASDELLASRAAELVGTQFPIGVPVLTAGGNYPTTARVACEASARCVVLYQQHEAGYSLQVRRFNAQGAIDPGLIVIAPDVGYPDVAAHIASRGDGEYLVTWRTNQGVFAARFDATTGKVVDATPLALGTLAHVFDFYGVAGTPAGYALLYADNQGPTSKLSVLRIAGGALLDSAGIPVLSQTGPGVIYGAGSQVAIAGPGGLSRFDFAQGTLLDATPIAFDKYAPVSGNPAIAFDGANYVLVWRTLDRRILTARVRAADGVLLDPPDQFNEVSGAHPIAVSAASNVGNPAAWFDGTNTVALWVTQGSANPLVGARINASGSRVQGDATSAYEFLLQNTREALDFRADFRAGFGMAAWQENAGIKAVRLQGNSGAVPTATPESVSFSGTTHTGAAIASNGADFLVAYAAAYPEPKVYARAISGLTGAPLGPQQLLTVGSETQVGLAWSGKFYIATMQAAGSVYARYVGCDGTPFSGDPLLLGPGSDARVACNDDRCALVWRSGGVVYIKRVDAQNGGVLDTTPLSFDVPSQVRGPEIASDQTPPPSQRTFMMVWTTSTGVSVRRLRSQGSLVSETPIESFASGGAYSPSIASDGSQFLTSWLRGTTLSSRLVDATNGTPLGTSTTTLANPVPSSIDFWSRLAFDGSSFVATWTDRAANKVRGLRLDKSNNSLDASGFDVAGYEHLSESVGSAPWGRSLVTYDAYDATTLSSLLVGRFYDNPLGAGTTASSSTCPSGSTGSGGSGGAGGAGGSSGSAASSGAGAPSSGGSGGSAGTSNGGSAGALELGGTSNGGTGSGIGGSPQAGAPPSSGAGDGGAGDGGEAGAEVETGGSGSSLAGAAQGGSGSTQWTSTAGSNDAGASEVSADAASSDRSGCSCNVAGQAQQAPRFWLAGLLVSALLYRRRRGARL